MTATAANPAATPIPAAGSPVSAVSPEAPLPPGPKLPSLIQSVLFSRYRTWWIPRMRQRYGDVFMIRVLPHNRRMVMVGRPDLIKPVFTTSATTLHAGEGNTILGPIMGDHSVLLLDESEHLRVRQLLMPAFHGAPMHGYKQMIEELTADEVAAWTVGVPMATHDRTTSLALEIILKVVFGVTDEQRLAELRPVVQKVVGLDLMMMMGWFYPVLQKVGPWRRFAELQREFDRLLYAEIADRRTAPDLAERSDVLSRLLTASGEQSLTDAELRDNLVTLLLAGHETTATALAWAFHDLARNPAVLARAQEAADARDDTYLEAVLKESLRVHPVIGQVARLVKEPVAVGGYRIPVDATIMPTILEVQNDANNHVRPESFDPERFIGTQPAPNTWIPFGGGVRRCLGAGFSLMEGTVILGEALRRFDVAPVDPSDERAKPRNITLTPADGGRVVLRRR